MQKARKEPAQQSSLEQRYKALRSRTRALLDANPDMIFRIDGDGRYLDFHSGNPESLVAAPEEFLGRTIDDLFGHALASVAMRNIRAALETRSMRICEYSLESAGELRDYEVRIVPTGENEIISIVRDITEKKRSALQLQRTESRLNQAQHVARIGSWEREVGTNEVWWSRETYELLDIDAAVPPAFETFLSRVHPQDRAHVVAAVEEAVARRRAYVSNLRIVLPKGRQRTLNSRAHVVVDAEGRAVRLVGTIQDITDRVELEREIVAAGERERERVGRDLHDGLGQTLTGISLSLKALSNRLQKLEDAPVAMLRQLENNVQEALSETRRAVRLLSPRMSGLPAALEDLARQFGQTPLRFSVTCETRHEAHHADLETHLYRIAQEAVCNAVKHAQARNIEVRYRCNGRTIRLEVADDGVGLPNAIPGGNAEAAGSGLANMRYRAHLINGDIELDEASGGLRVVCHCPCALDTDKEPIR